MTRRIRMLQILAALIAMALIVGAVFRPQAAAAGWLAGFVFWASIPLGALGLIMIHRLVGGRWGEVIAPVLAVTARAVPLLWFGIIPIFVAIPVLFVWYGGEHARPDVLAHYLNWPFYLLRGIAILGGFTVLSLTILRLRAAVGLAAIGMIFFAVALTIAGLDWVLALEPGTYFTGFGAATAIEYLAAALAWTVLAFPDMPQQTRDDMAGLMIATVLGSIYLNYMDFMIVWYGDVPSRIAWFLPRSAMPWKPFLVAALLFGGIGPLVGLLFGRTRFLGDGLKPAAISMLFGFSCYEIWQVLPPFGVIAIPFAVAAMAGIGALALAFAGDGRLAGRRAEEAGHG